MPGPILAAVLGPLTTAIGTVIDRVIVDKNAAEKAKLEMERELLRSSINGELAQLEINKIEAANPNIFVSGWRPFIGWVCAAALAFQYVLSPLGIWIARFFMEIVPMPPSLDGILYELLFAMLGLGTMRTVEKINGVARK
jgi:hypothetical protein